MITFGAVLLLLLFSLFIFGEKQSEFIFSKEQIQAKNIAKKVAQTTNNVFLAGNGTQTTVVLEKTFDYNVLFSGNSVQVKWRDNFSDAALLSNKATSQEISSGNIIIVKNVQGEIFVETT